MNCTVNFFTTGNQNTLRLSYRCPVRGYLSRRGQYLISLRSMWMQLERPRLRSTRKEHQRALDMNEISWSQPAGASVAKVSRLKSWRSTEQWCWRCQSVSFHYSGFGPRCWPVWSTLNQSSYHTGFFRVAGQRKTVTPKSVWVNILTMASSRSWNKIRTGLQVLNTNASAWVHASLEAAFVENLRDMLQR